jgi:inorganic pyrophosphatase/exopolyphosphatase
MTKPTPPKTDTEKKIETLEVRLAGLKERKAFFENLAKQTADIDGSCAAAIARKQFGISECEAELSKLKPQSK